MSARILIIDDEASICAVIGRYLEHCGYVCRHVGTLAQAKQLLHGWRPDLTLTDHNLPDATAFDVINALDAGEAAGPIIVMTGCGSIDLAVQAMKRGAENFVTKPIDLEALSNMVARCLQERRRQRREAADQVLAERGDAALDPFLGQSRAIARVRDLANAVVHSEAPVLILGETGSGKGVLAKWMHSHGPRSGEPFVDLNCSGLSRELAESELFGHQKGSFTNATASKPGLVEVAHRGTLFLDEIGDLDQAVQPKLLKVLEEQTYRKVGDVRSRHVDVRLIAATHRKLAEMAQTGAFRADLLFRINTITVDLPALRERREDIPSLASHILRSLAPHLELSQGAVDALVQHNWPGNVRELRNALERAVLLCRDGRIEAKLFSFAAEAGGAEATSALTLKDVERRHIVEVLQHTGGHVGEAAELLDIPRSSLYAKLKKLGLAAS